MAGRIRSIKPELLEDGKTASLPDRAFRVFIGMLLLADDHGNLRADSNYLAGAITFGIGGTSRETEEALAELSSRGLARVYEVRNQRYASIVNWTKHQKVDHPSKPRVPTPNDEGVLILDDPREKTRRPSRLISDLRPPIPIPTPKGTPMSIRRPLELSRSSPF